MPRNSLNINKKLLSILSQLGENIKLARLRRNISMEEISIKTNISLPTIRKIEQGNPNVSIGLYSKILQTMELETDIAKVGYADTNGRKLQDKNLGERVNRK